MTTTNQQARETLSANIDKLSVKDRAFAQSLLSNKHPSDKVLYWINKMAERAVADRPVAQVEVVGANRP